MGLPLTVSAIFSQRGASNPTTMMLGELRFNLHNKVSTTGSVAKFFFEGLATDIVGNAYVMATDDKSPTGAGTISKFTPGGERIVFGSVPGTTPGNDLQANGAWPSTARAIFTQPTG